MWWAQARDTAHHSTVNRTTPVNKGLSSPVCQELRGWEILNPTSIQCSCFTQEDNWRLLLLLLRRFSVSNSVQPLRRQPTRLRCPWDSPGKNTGVGCHFLLQWVKVKSEREVAQSCLTLCDSMDCSLPGSSAHGIFQARGLEWVATAFSNWRLEGFKNLLES